MAKKDWPKQTSFGILLDLDGQVIQVTRCAAGFVDQRRLGSHLIYLLGRSYDLKLVEVIQLK